MLNALIKVVDKSRYSSLLISAFFILCTIDTLKAQTSPQTFTTNGTFTVPAGVTCIQVEAWGGGGGTRSGDNRRGGGGGGAYARSVITVTPASNHTVIIGAGGQSNTNPGQSGGHTSF